MVGWIDEMIMFLVWCKVDCDTEEGMGIHECLTISSTILSCMPINWMTMVIGEWWLLS